MECETGGLKETLEDTNMDLCPEITAGKSEKMNSDFEFLGMQR